MSQRNVRLVSGVAAAVVVAALVVFGVLRSRGRHERPGGHEARRQHEHPVAHEGEEPHEHPGEASLSGKVADGVRVTAVPLLRLIVLVTTLRTASYAGK